MDNVSFGSHDFSGTPNSVLAGKLIALKNNLKKWNDEEFRKIDDQKVLLQELSCFDENETAEVLLDADEARKNVVMADLKKITLMEKISWRQFSDPLVEGRGQVHQIFS